MKQVSGRTMCKLLKARGWELFRTHGSHHIYKKQGVAELASVPVHGNRPLAIGTLKDIIKKVGLTENDL